MCKLLDFNSRASFFQSFLRSFSNVFRNVFLNSARSAVNQTFGFFQTQTSQFTYGFDHVHFLVAGRSQDYGEFGLLFSSFSSSCRTSSYSSSSGYAEFFFHRRNQFYNVHYRHFGDSVDDLFFSQRHETFLNEWSITLVKSLNPPEIIRQLVLSGREQRQWYEPVCRRQLLS